MTVDAGATAEVAPSCSDVDGDALSISGVSGAANGTVALEGTTVRFSRSSA